MRPTLKSRFTVAVATAGLIAATMTGCSASGADNSTPRESTLDLSQFPTLEDLYDGTSRPPPETGPAAAPVKSVWVINCGSACNYAGDAAEEAIGALGWKYNYADGNLNIEGGYAKAIRTALAASPDALYLQGFSCQLASQALQEARDQGVPTISVEGVNCDGADGQPLFTVPNGLNEQVGDDITEFWKESGRRAAWYLIAERKADVKVITTRGVDPLEVAISDGFREVMTTCDGCEIAEEIPAPGTDLVPNGPFIQAFRTSLVRHPDANGIFLPFDFMYGTLGGAAAVREVGSSATLTGGQGLAESRDFVAEGVLAWPAAFDDSFKAWAAMDNLNRHFNGQATVLEGVGLATVTQETPEQIPPEGMPYAVPFDYKSTYQKIWTGK